MLKATTDPLCSTYDVALLDLDGVIYIGSDAVEGAPEALAAARESGLRYGYVTNNASRTPEVVAAHLRHLDVPAKAEDVVTSAQAAATELQRLIPPHSSVLVVGGEGLAVALRERSLSPVSQASDEPAAVAQGWSPDLNWPILREGSLALATGVPWVVSNTDLTVNVPGGIAPACGSFVEVLRLTTGRHPDVVAGKPHPPMHRESIRRTRATKPLVVGDRLDTDIEGAVRAGVDSLLVFTGVTDIAAAVAAPRNARPTYLSADLRGLLQPHPEVVTGDGHASCGGWRASVADDRLDLVGSGDAGDALRAACASAWAHADATGRPPADISAISAAMDRRD